MVGYIPSDITTEHSPQQKSHKTTTQLKPDSDYNMPTSSGPKIVRDGLVLSLNAADRNSYVSGSTTWFDLSGNNNSGSLTNGPTFNSANGGSLSFDGTNDIITITSTGIVANNISVDIWFNVNSAKTYAALLGSNETEKYEMLIKTASNLISSCNYGRSSQINTIFIYFPSNTI